MEKLPYKYLFLIFVGHTTSIKQNICFYKILVYLLFILWFLVKIIFKKNRLLI